MATLDDKLLGEKLQYYCSSSEDEKEEGSGDEDEGAKMGKAQAAPAPDFTQDMTHWQGNSANTGPKGKNIKFPQFSFRLLTFINNFQVSLKTGKDSSNWRQKRGKHKNLRSFN